MTIDDLLKLPGGMLAAAPLLAALVAAVTLILSSLINARTARIVARDTFRRSQRASSLQPFLEHLQERVETYQAVIEAGPQVSAKLRSIATLLPDAQAVRERVVEIRESLRELVERLRDTNKALRDTAALAVIAGDQRLLDTAYEWLQKNQAFIDFVAAHPSRITANPDSVRKLNALAENAMWQAAELRNVIEDLIVEPRGWWARQTYSVTRQFKKRLRKLKTVSSTPVVASRSRARE